MLAQQERLALIKQLYEDGIKKKSIKQTVDLTLTTAERYAIPTGSHCRHSVLLQYSLAQ